MAQIPNTKTIKRKNIVLSAASKGIAPINVDIGKKK
jgi:hypothetical protein